MNTKFANDLTDDDLAFKHGNLLAFAAVQSLAESNELTLWPRSSVVEPIGIELVRIREQSGVRVKAYTPDKVIACTERVPFGDTTMSESLGMMCFPAWKGTAA